MDSSMYTSLHGDSRQFRLLVLEPSPDRLAPLRCELNQASFDDDDLEYTALSYTWGDPKVTTPVLVNGMETHVTLNLEAALRHIRKPSAVVILWVDALCINQADVNEKNHQVQMMREIFSGAELVIAWLGSAGEDSDLAMEILRTGVVAWFKAWLEGEEERQNTNQDDGGDLTGTSSSVLNDESSHHSPVGGEEDITTASARVAASELVEKAADLQLPNPTSGIILEGTGPGVIDKHQDENHTRDLPSISPASRSSSCSEMHPHSYERGFYDKLLERPPPRELLAIKSLLTRSWWSRIWVVQEVLLAKKVIFMCGDAEVPGEKMRDNVESLWSLVLMAGIDSDSAMTYFEALGMLKQIGAQNSNTGAVTCLLQYSSKHATRPHDHVYGLFGIITKEDQTLLGAPDYDCGVEDLFISVATKLMLRDNSLELLEAAAYRSSSAAVSTEIHLPSWIPNWTRSLSLTSDRNALHWAMPFSEAEFRFSEDSKELMLECFEIETIESVKSVPVFGQGRMPAWQNVQELKFHQRSPPFLGIIFALFMCYWVTEDTGTSDRLDSKDGFEFVAALIQELEEYRIPLGRDGISRVHNKSDYLAGFLEWTNESRGDRTDEEVFEKVFSIPAAHSFVEWYHRQSTANLQRSYTLYSRIRTIFEKTFMFRTRKGSFSTTFNAEVAPGDVVCMVPTCNFPLVFREVQSSKHMLIGLCDPIAGMMVEWLKQAVEKGEIVKKSFTLV